MLDLLEPVARYLRRVLPDSPPRIASVDATFLERAQRSRFAELVARLGAPIRLILCEAPEPVPRARIAERNRSKSDPSEADLGVLEWQLCRMEVPTAEEAST